ncbi:hypothetical protein A7X67_01465 [Clostridium sp. W14A]|nr:hypothetical protein A7X67_01465 [Clostridium sp. W14A]
MKEKRFEAVYSQGTLDVVKILVDTERTARGSRFCRPRAERAFADGRKYIRIRLNRNRSRSFVSFF